MVQFAAVVAVVVLKPFASGRAIEAVSSQWDDPCDPKEVFTRFRQNDEKATALVTRSAQAIANFNCRFEDRLRYAESRGWW